MRDDAGLSVLWFLCTHDFASKVVRDALHPQADSKNWRLLANLGNYFSAHAKILFIGGVSWARRNNNAVILTRFYFVECDPIIADDIEGEGLSRRRKDLPYVLIEVVRKRIVVVYNEDLHTMVRARVSSRQVCS